MEDQKFLYKSKDFVEELKHINDVRKFTSGDKDLNAYIETKHRRADKLGLTIHETFGQPDSLPNNRSRSYRDISYQITQEDVELSHEMTVMSGSKKLFHHASSRVKATMDVVDLIDKSNLPKDTYTCPNCGNFTSADVLSGTGCPYCGTHFEIPQLFPKISTFTYKELNYDDTKVADDPAKQTAFRIAAVVLVIEVLIGFSVLIENWPNATPLIAYWFVALFILFFSFIIPYAFIYNLKSTTNHFKHSTHAIKTFKIEQADDVSSRNFENDMRAYTPNFNFEYFSSKVYNLLGAVIFCEDESEVPSYRGPDFCGSFDSIFEYIPLGIKLHSLNAEARKFATIDLSVFADVYSYFEGEVKYRKAEFRFKVTKNLSYPIKYLFSARAFNCSGCSSTYDVTKSANCPYCGRPHDVLDQDWFIDGAVDKEFIDVNIFNIHEKI